MNEKGIPKKITAEKQWRDKKLVYRNLKSNLRKFKIRSTNRPKII